MRRTAKILSELHPISHNTVHNWIRNFGEKLPISTEKKRRNLVAIDETIVKANRKRYYVYVAIDAERNELILMSLQGKESFDCEVPRQECLITAMESPNS